MDSADVFGNIPRARRLDVDVRHGGASSTLCAASAFIAFIAHMEGTYTTAGTEYVVAITSTSDNDRIFTKA